MQLGAYPTPVDRIDDALGEGRPLWVKRDDLTSPRYGGNKVRKLERVLERARSRGVRRIVTVGAAGSHHALATALYARDLGIEVEAVLVPQLRTSHVAENLRVTAALSRVFPATSFAHAATIVVDRIACGADYVPPGGSTRDSSAAYADAADELIEQIARGDLPAPRVVVVALGSGGTAAGLAAGFARAGTAVRVLGVLVSEPRAWVVRRARRLAEGCLRHLSPDTPVSSLHLEIDDRYLGDGYGTPSAAGVAALARAARLGLTLDSTYTAKTFAAVLDLPEETSPVLYWHTLSSAPLAPLLVDAPSEVELRPSERALLRAPEAL